MSPIRSIDEIGKGAQAPSSAPGTAAADVQEVTRLRDLSSRQWRSGTAAWLGWLFDGLDMHLYTLVATPFVAELLHARPQDDSVAYCSSWIQAAFLVGWAVGGGFFGRIGDRLGRSRALMLTILTYAMFTGLSAFAQTWWQLLIFRFLAALGIGGEWGVGASLLSETWPKRWRPWVAAVLQTAVNLGVMLACLAGYLLSAFHPRYVFLVGILPALLVLWIRRAVPETEEWHEAKLQSKGDVPGILDLFRGSVRKITVLTILVCSFSLAGHWAFLFWWQNQLRFLPGVMDWSSQEKQTLISAALLINMIAAIVGNFLAGFVARYFGYRRSIVLFCLLYFAILWCAYYPTRDYQSLLFWMAPLGACQGVFALFTMYLPPLFPTLLRSTGAGFCYNIGRIAAAGGTVFFGIFGRVAGHTFDASKTMLYASFLFLPAAAVAYFLTEPPDERAAVTPID